MLFAESDVNRDVLLRAARFDEFLLENAEDQQLKDQSVQIQVTHVFLLAFPVFFKGRWDTPRTRDFTSLQAVDNHFHCEISPLVLDSLDEPDHIMCVLSVILLNYFEASPTIIAHSFAHLGVK